MSSARIYRALLSTAHPIDRPPVHDRAPPSASLRVTIRPLPRKHAVRVTTVANAWSQLSLGSARKPSKMSAVRKLTHSLWARRIVRPRRHGGENKKRIETAKSLICGRSSVVERQLPKLYVVGSIPIARSRFFQREPIRGTPIEPSGRRRGDIKPEG